MAHEVDQIPHKEQLWIQLVYGQLRRIRVPYVQSELRLVDVCNIDTLFCNIYVFFYRLFRTWGLF